PGERALKIRKELWGEVPPDYGDSLDLVGRLYKQVGGFDRAQPVLVQAAEVRRQALGEAHHDHIRSLITLGSLYQARGQYPKAEALYQRSLNSLTTWGKQDPKLAKTLRNEVMGYRRKERERSWAAAKRLWDTGLRAGAVGAAEKVLAIERDLFGKAHPDLVDTLEMLAGVYAEREDFAAARKARQEVLAIQTQLHGVRDWRVTNARRA